MFGIVNWNFDPTLFQLGFLTVRWYGLLFALSFITGTGIGNWIYRREGKPVEQLDRLIIFLMIGTVVGARLGHVLFYDPVYYLSNPLEILKTWKGGLASHGAGIGIILALYLYAKKTPGMTFFWVADRTTIVIALSGFFIRIGNLLNSEIIGKPTHADWGFIFHRVDPIPRHPAQLYEASAYLLVFLVLWGIYLKIGKKNYPGVLTGAVFIMIFTARFLIEFVKETQSAFESGWALNMGQLLSIPAVLGGVMIMIWSLRMNPKRGVS